MDLARSARQSSLPGGVKVGRGSTMKAILLSRTGDPSVLEYTEVPTPRPGPGEVLVKADTIGVSRPELLVRRGRLPWMPPLPAIPGIEMAGTVAELGAGATRLRGRAEGVCQRARAAGARRLLCRIHRGAGARAVRAAAGEPISKRRRASRTIRWRGTSCTPRRAACRARSALIGSASGGLGSAAVQLAKLAGMTAIALVGSAEKARALKAFGADHVIDHRREDVAARVADDHRRRGRRSGARRGRRRELRANISTMLGAVRACGVLRQAGRRRSKANVVDALDDGPGYLNSARGARSSPCTRSTTSRSCARSR